MRSSLYLETLRTLIINMAVKRAQKCKNGLSVSLCPRGTMPVVTKLSGPSETHSPLIYSSEKPLPLYRSDNRRQDGRLWNEIRNISIQTGVVHDVTGSAYVELGQTKVLCSIIGPKHLSRGEDFSPEGQVSCNFKFAPFSCKSRKHVQQQEEKQISLIISEAMTSVVKTHTFPNLQIDVNLITLQNDGSILTAGILCASVALATSGIQIKDIPTACTVSYGKEGMFLCDPIISEEYEPFNKVDIIGQQTVAYLPSLKEICGLHQVGVVELKMASNLMDVCIEGSLRLSEVIKQYLKTE